MDFFFLDQFRSFYFRQIDRHINYADYFKVITFPKTINEKWKPLIPTLMSVLMSLLMCSNDYDEAANFEADSPKNTKV